MSKDIGRLISNVFGLRHTKNLLGTILENFNIVNVARLEGVACFANTMPSYMS